MRGLKLQVERGQQRRKAFDVGSTVARHQPAESVGDIPETLQERRGVGVTCGNQPQVAGVEGEARRIGVADGVQREHLRAIRLLLRGDGPVAQGEI